MFRNIAEKFARNIVFRRRLPTAFGRRSFYVTPDSALAYLKPGFAAFSDLIAIASQCVHDGDGVWDIGANVGLFSMLAADRAGSEGCVVSVEPDPVLASLIQRSARLPKNADRTIDVLCCAVSDRSQIAKFSVAQRGRSSNSLERSINRTQAGGTRYTQLVPTTTLDQMAEALPPPTLIKIDVEGAEALVLEGGRKLLSEHRPQLYVEVGGKQSVEATAILKSLGYDLFDGTQPLQGQKPGSRCTFYTLAIHPQRMQPAAISNAA